MTDAFEKAFERAAVKYAEHMEMLLTESVNIKPGEAVRQEPGMHVDLREEKDMPGWFHGTDVEKREITLAIGMAILAVIGESMKELEGEYFG